MDLRITSHTLSCARAMKPSNTLLLSAIRAAFVSIAIVGSSYACALETPSASTNTAISTTAFNEILHNETGLEPLRQTDFQRSQIKRALTVIDDYHVNARSIKEDHLRTAVVRYMNRLDPNRIYFANEDVERIVNDALMAHDDILDGDLTIAFSTFNDARQRAINFFDWAITHLDSPFDFDSQRYWEINDDGEAPWVSAGLLADRWDMRVSNDYLSLKITGVEPQKIKEKLIKRYSRNRSQWLKRNNDDVVGLFSDSMTEIFDPHTTYLSPRSGENFNINISLSLSGIGAVLQQDGDYTVVSRLISGGPAKASKAINPGDRIVGVAQDGEPFSDVIGERLDDVVDQIRGEKGTIVRLQITKKGQEDAIKEVAITRDTITLEDKIARSDIIEQPQEDENVKIGIIELPTFYTDFEALRNGKQPEHQTSTDVLRLTEEFKQQGVDALLIDLRGDGGGPLTEAIALTGLFIDEGPVVQVQGRNANERNIYPDPIPGVAWDGPLAVLVDRNSASASEIFAGAIQDYGRGLILGETTFGKGSVQSLVSLAPFFGKSKAADYGQVKLTTSKFYRVNGDSTQNKGVVPDISIPMPLPNHETGERSLDFALPFTRIERAAIPLTAASIDNNVIDVLTSGHQSRIAQSEKFAWILETQEFLTELVNRKKVALNLTERKSEQTANDERMLKLDNMKRSILGEEPLSEIERNNDDELTFEPDEESDVFEKDDFVLEEATQILTDYFMLSRDKVVQN